MAGEWEICQWGDIATLEYGKSLRGYQDSTGRYRVYGTNGPIGWHDNALCKLPGVIIGRKGAYRGVHYCAEPFFVIDTAFYLKPRIDIDLKWAYYCLLTYDINGMDSGSAIPSTSRDSFYCLPVKVPPKNEQKAIACILGALDDKIECNRRMNQTLEEMARSIFKSWFVDFDPVRAKAAGQEPPGLAPHIADLFPDGFEESELGEVPLGWSLSKISEFAKFNVRTLGQREHLEVIDYIEISKVMQGTISEITRYNRGAEPSRARRMLNHDDTGLSTVRPDRGAYFLCLNPSESLIASTGFAVATSKSGQWAFLHVALTRPEVGQELGRLADGGAYPAIRPDVIEALITCMPQDRGIIDEFERIAQPLFEKAHNNRIQSGVLASIRDTLLPKLISGELPILDAERIVGRCS